MVQHRRLQEKVEAGLLHQGGTADEKLQLTISELKAKQDAYDQDVARLMAEDESISQEISVTETSLHESAEALKELNRHLEEIGDAQKEDLGVASVRIGGNVYSGTSFTGPHALLVLQENLKRLSIVETDKPDHNGLKRWHFELNPYR
jgi:septal ring factor EnvC (AmiA/AmiB activator)